MNTLDSLLELSEPLTRIITISIPVITALLAISGYLLKTLILDPFDIKLLHKRKHTGIKIAKSFSSIILFTLFFLGIDWYLFYVIKQFSVLEIVLLFTVIVYFILFIFSLITFKIHDFYIKRKIKKSISHIKKKGGIFNSFINNFNSIFLISTIFLFILFGTLFLVVLDYSKEEINNSIAISFLFSIFPSIMIFLYKPLRTKRYELSKILTDPIEIANSNLNLEYYINDSTSVLSNKSKNIVAIKSVYDGNYSVEIYEIIDIYQPTSKESKKQ